MNKNSRLFLIALGLMSVAMPAFAEDDDLLRPMIVRPTETSASAPPPPSSSAMLAPAGAPSSSETLLVSQAASDDSGARLHLPPPPKASGPMLTSRGATLSSGSNVFADFGPPSGSVVSDRVFQLRDETVALRRNIDKDEADFNELRGKGASGAIQYHATVAAIKARLEAGTTRGNPVLLRQWGEAEQSLTEVNYSISKLNALQTDLSANSATAAYELQAVRATFELAGAVEEDHKQLGLIRDEVTKGTVQIDRMRADVSEDIIRQTNYLAVERQNLQALALGIDRGELIHNSLASKSVVIANPPTTMNMPGASTDYTGYPSVADDGVSNMPTTVIMPAPDAAPTTPVQKSALPKRKPVTMNEETVMPMASNTAQAATPVAAPTTANSLGQLLVLVRFNQDEVDYEQQLYQAISDALDRRPNANFTVVAVTPRNDNSGAIGSDTGSALRHADDVKNSLVQLGLQPSRISMSNISSEAAQTPEVHVYVR
jgi:hypothetical protein